jgi:uncharacterized membrane protein YuzA (DUF378 family)
MRVVCLFLELGLSILTLHNNISVYQVCSDTNQCIFVPKEVQVHGPTLHIAVILPRISVETQGLPFTSNLIDIFDENANFSVVYYSLISISGLMRASHSCHDSKKKRRNSWWIDLVPLTFNSQSRISNSLTASST